VRGNGRGSEGMDKTFRSLFFFLIFKFWGGCEWR
jgi:hypothetical protein